MSINRRTAEVVIYQGDDLATLTQLRNEADLAERRYLDAKERNRATALRVGDGEDLEPLEATLSEARAAFDAFVDEASERAQMVRVQALGRVRFRDIRLEHPPRKVDEEIDGETRKVDHPDDAHYGVNTLTFGEKLLSYVDREDDEVRTIVEPTFSTEKDRRNFLDEELSDGDFEQLWTTAFYLNTSTGADPKALRFSAPPLISAKSSG